MKPCKHCGAYEDLHHADTSQCPVGGYEAPPGKRQMWNSTVYKANDNEEVEKIIRDYLVSKLRISFSYAEHNDKVIRVSIMLGDYEITNDAVRIQ